MFIAMFTAGRFTLYVHLYKAPFTQASELASPGVMCVHIKGAGMSRGKTGLLPLDSGPG